MIQTTCALLETQGYHATGLAQILTESGAPKGSMYYYFPEGKEALAEAALRQSTEMVVQRIQDHLTGGSAPGQALRRFASVIADAVEASGFRAGGPLTTVALETATTNERLNRVCRESYEQMRLAFEAHLLAGGLAPRRAAELSLVILSALEGAILLSRTNHSGEPLRAMGRVLEALVDQPS